MARRNSKKQPSPDNWMERPKQRRVSTVEGPITEDSFSWVELFFKWLENEAHLTCSEGRRCYSTAGRSPARVQSHWGHSFLVPGQWPPCEPRYGSEHRTMCLDKSWDWRVDFKLPGTYRQLQLKVTSQIQIFDSVKQFINWQKVSCQIFWQ